MGAKILIGPSSFAETCKTPLKRLLAAGYEVIENPFKRKLTKPELLTLLAPDVIGLIAGLEPIDREVLGRSRLKVVSRVGAGMANVDSTAATELGIGVFSTPDGPTDAVAELTIGALLGLLRMIPLMDRALHDGQWVKRIGTQLDGKTVAIIGFGRIGRRVAELLAPFRARIVVCDPYLSGDLSSGVVCLSLESALSSADVVTLHCSGEDRLIGAREFALMKEGIFLLNAARGGLVDEEALADALERGKVAGAWLDTYSQEPYTGKLRAFPNVVLTPHVGSYTRECRLRMETEAVDNLLEALKKAAAR